MGNDHSHTRQAAIPIGGMATVTAHSQIVEAISILVDLAGLGSSRWTDGIDSSGFEVQVDLRDLAWPQIQSAANCGVRLHLVIKDELTGELAIDTTTGGAFATDLRGEFDQSLGGEDLRRFREACESGSLQTIIELLQSNVQAACTLWANWENRPADTSCHWIRTRAALLSQLSTPATALAIARRLATTPRVRRLVVSDAKATLTSTHVFVVHGPTDWPAAPEGEWTDDATAAYARAYQHQRGDLAVPSPLAFVPAADRASDKELTTALSRLASLLAWSWMSVDSRNLRFDGVRTLEFRPFLPLSDTLDSTISLWSWAVSSPGMDRREALERAITLSVFREDDLRQAPSILKNARWFLDLTQRDAVTEALATRRQVREAALSTAAAVASRTADASSKAFDRVAVQIAAAIAIIFAQYKSVLDVVSAGRFLAAVVGLLIISGVLSVGLDFRFIANGLGAFKQDLQVYRETLSDEDVEAVTTLSSLTQAALQNRRRWVAAVALHIIAIAAVLAATGVILQGHFLTVFP